MLAASRRRSRRIAVATGLLIVLMAGAALQLTPSGSRRAQPPPIGPEAARRARENLSDVRFRHGEDSLESARAVDALLEASPEDAPDLEPLARRALSIKERLLGAGHLEVARTLEAAAGWLIRSKHGESAIPLAERGLRIRMAAAGPRDPDTLHMMHVLAEACRQAGRIGRALRVYEQAVHLIGRQLGPAHAMLAAPLHYAGILRSEIGDRREARRLLERSLAIRMRSHGPSDDLVASTLNALGNLRLRDGDLEGAIAAYVRAEAAWRRNQDAPFHHVARAVTNQGLVRLRQGDFPGAERLLREALAIRESGLGRRHHLTARGRIHLANLHAAMGRMTEAEAGIRGALEDQEDQLGPDNPELMHGLGSLARLELLEGRADEAIATALRCARIWQQHARRSAPDVPDAEVDPLDTALAAIAGWNAAPAWTARVWQERVRSAGLRAGRASQDDPIGALRRALPDGTALITFARHVRPSAATGAEDGEAYIALVLRHGAGPEAVTLGDASRVDAAVEAWRAEASFDPRSAPASEADARYSARARELAALVWLPVQQALGDARRIWVVADGPLRRVNLATLVDARGAYILETGPAVHAIESEHTLLIPSRPGEGSGVLALGGPDFGEGDCGERLRFDPLPGARAEVETLRSAWGGEPVLSLTGDRATERAFRLLAPGRRVLHIATHAFAMGPADARPPRDPELSGLALRGANDACWRGDEADDGLLTGREIGGLDLSGVEWAVLSGCETGVGPADLGRAFQQAGVQRVLTTLWPVEDGAARAWMEHFYGRGLIAMDAAQAVQEASRAILEEQRRRGGTTHPFFWGGFVSSGDDR